MMPEEQPIFNNQILDTSLNQPVSNLLDPSQKDYTEISSDQMMHLAGETLIDAWENQGDAKQALVYAGTSIFNSNFTSNAEIAFGESFHVQKAQALGDDILTGKSGVFPDVEFLSNAEMKGALGAYAESTKTIYINSDFLIDNVDNPGAIGKVLVEEKGHFIDAYANPVDSDGDEGEILAGLVTGENFTTNELESLKLEDDSTTLVVDGQELRVEQSFSNRVLELTNAERAKAGLSPLKLNSQLNQAAQGHSKDMALRDYYSHTGVNGSKSSNRILATGYKFSAAAENIAAGFATPEKVVQAWMGSSGHRRNILNSKYKDIGIGHYFLANDTGDTNYNHYWTQNFGVSATPTVSTDLAGNSTTRARRISIGSTTANFTDSVGRTDTNDYYRFTLNRNSDFKLSLSGLTENADVRLLTSSGRTITSSSKSGNSSEAINRQLDAGNYFIRVLSRTRGNTNYNLGVSATPPAPDFAGNTLNTARSISVGSTTTNFTDSVGRTDTNDYYRFTLNQNSDFKLSLSGLTENADVRLLSSSGRTITSSFKSRNSSEAINRQLDAGNYFIQVLSRTRGNTDYNLGVSATPPTPDLAGNSRTTARLITIGSTTTNFTDAVGRADSNDYYRFTLNQNSDFKLSLSGLTENADVWLLNSSGRTITSSRKSGNSSEAINRQLDAGNYFIRVLPRTGTNTDYNLGVSATPLTPRDFAGNTLNRARLISVGSRTTNFTDWVGRTDTNDYYRFTLNQNSNFKLSLSGLKANADVQLIQDINGNSRIDANEILGSSNLKGNSTESIIVPLSSGQYFVRIYPGENGINTTYNLSLSNTSIGNSTYTDSSAIKTSYYNTPVNRSFFNNGISTYQSQHGNFIMHGAIADYYTNNQFANNDTNNGLFGVYSGLGLPTSAIYKKDDGSFVMEFEGGTLTNRNGIVIPSYNQKASSFALVGQGAPNRTELQWKNDYSYWSKDVGTPTSKVRFVAGGWVQEFADSQSKVINILTVKNGRQLTQGGPYRVQGAILDNYRLAGGYERQNAGLGFATRSEQSNVNGYKHYQSFENGFIGINTDNKVIIKNRQGQLLNVTGYDGTAIHSTYRNTFNRVGSSLLGSPVSNVRPSGNGFLQEFAGGSDGRGAIMKSNANDKSYWVGGDFWNKLQQAGGAGGILSYATSERYTTVSGASRQNFQGGAIIKSAKGIFTVYGGIGSHYLKEGGERGRLGLPTSSEAGIGNGVIVQNFEKGRIVWNRGSARTEMPLKDVIVPTPPTINHKNFIGVVTPSIGVNLRNSSNYDDKSRQNRAYGQVLTFNAWTTGSSVKEINSSIVSNRWFRVAGTNFWVPDAYINEDYSKSTPAPAPTPTPNPSPSPTPTPTPEPINGYSPFPPFQPTPTPPRGTTIPTGNWKAEFFNNVRRAGNPVVVQDWGSGSKNFSRDWGNGSPAARINSDNFSARLTTRRYFAAGSHQIQTTSDDGVRVNIGNRTIINRFVDQSSVTHTGIFDAGGGGWFNVAVDYYERGGGANLSFNVNNSFKGSTKVNGTSYSWELSKYNKDGKTNNWQIDPNKTTIVVAHGRVKEASNSVNNLEQLAKTAADKFGHAQVLFLDWRNASADPGEFLTTRPVEAGKRIGAVANDVYEALHNNLGLNTADKLYFYGHSLGSLLLTKVAEKYGKIEGFASLDPAADAEGYDFDNDGNWWEDELPDIKTIAKKSVALVTADKKASIDGGIAGDNTHAATANKSYIVDFRNYDKLGRRIDDWVVSSQGDYHNAVVDTFTGMLESGLYVDLLASASDITNDQWGENGSRKAWYNPGFFNHEGVIDVNFSNSNQTITVERLKFINSSGQTAERRINEEVNRLA
ncbi:MAG: pre-peptidase C-terminal domain-containing protein [Rivularia sp. (in: cyanobacteria)]